MDVLLGDLVTGELRAPQDVDDLLGQLPGRDRVESPFPDGLEYAPW